MPDELFDARNYLNIGSYNQAIAEASSAGCASHKGEDVANFEAEKTAIICRAQLGLGQVDLVLSQLKSATHPVLKSVSLWANFLSSTRGADPSAADVALNQLVANAEVVSLANIYGAIFATAALLNRNQVAEGLTLAKRWLADLPEPEQSRSFAYIELRSLVVEGLLRLNRADRAVEEVAAMEKLDDEAVLTILYMGLVYLAQGQLDNKEESYNSALASFKDIAMRYSNSTWVLNLIGVTQMCLGDFEASKNSLLEALSLRSDDGDTLSNLVAVCNQIGLDTQRYFAQASQQQSLYAHQYRAASDAFDVAVRDFKH
ncbi:coatomer epsilon subunit [Angomonas deanei]|uniref:Coatomer subunit epsilon n=1 Tax=Angomonas deanei TaxID=59799 RepID=A0A7G2C8Z4_9TRYP|nr:coatomer epsilon subunit [Angomonas deanei]CAD2216256.1 Coatomer epsilon subunit, putative [Angomonas deanei]|eukprot:EPY42279.1 coatomer epsilon subunit [Angomonas deanei]